MSIRNILFTLLAMFIVAGPALATDPPHDSSNSIECLNCHSLHSSLGDALTTLAGNANLCQSCHVFGGTATNKPFVQSDQAQPGLALPAGMTAGGNSHRWDSGPQGRIEAAIGNTSTGTVVSAGAYTRSTIQTYTIEITSSGNVGVAQFKWNVQIDNGGVLNGTGTTGTNVTLSDGLTLTFGDGGVSPSFVNGDIWYLYAVADLAVPTDPEMLVRLEGETIMCSTCHDQHSQKKTPFDPLAPAYSGPGTGEGRHNQRIDNDTDQMCKDCHGARHVSSSTLGSHPVGVGIPTGGDFQSPAGLPLDAANKVSCLTCHDMHFNGASNGQLLRINNIQTMCTECHTLASGAASHFNTTAGELWPGGQYGSSYPALSDAGKVASCANCHYPHGWPDNASPTVDYPMLTVDFEEGQCYTCHDGAPAADILTDIQKASGHPLAATSGVHDSAEAAVVNSATRHVECNDCHNPHEAENRVSVPGASTSPRLASTGPMTGVQGVNTSGSTVATASYEYEVCFRCHADSTGKPAARTTREFPETNVRVEFTAKTSYHPVTKVGATTANGDMPSLINGWAANSIASCTNCHNSNSGPAAGGAGPNGAHGSTWPPLLEKRFDTSDPSTYAEAKYASCFSCHSATNILSDDNKSFKEHDKHIRGEDVSCNICHDPHASSNDRLINFDTSVVTPFNGKIEFKWNGAGSGSCQLSCHGKNHDPFTY